MGWLRYYSALLEGAAPFLLGMRLLVIAGMLFRARRSSCELANKGFSLVHYRSSGEGNSGQGAYSMDGEKIGNLDKP